MIIGPIKEMKNRKLPSNQFTNAEIIYTGARTRKRGGQIIADDGFT